MERRIFVVLFIAVLASTMGISIIEPLMAIYSESLGASGLYIGLIFVAFTISRGLFTPIAGKLSDHHGRKSFIILGLIVFTVSSFLYIFAKDLNTLLIVRFIQGMSTAFVAPIAMAYIGDIAPKNQEGSYLGTFTISMFLGFALGPVVGGTLNHLFDINMAFVAMGILGLVSLVLVIVLLPEIRARHGKPTGFRKLLKIKTMQEILLIRFATSYGVAGFIVFLPLYAVSIGLNTAEIGIMVTLNLLVTASLQRYFGKIADRHSKIKLMAIGNLILAATILLIPLTWNFYSLLVLNLIMGFGGGVSIPANTAVAAQMGKEHGMGSVMGLLNAAFAVGMTIGPLTAGVILDFSGLATVFFFTGAMVVGGTLLYYVYANRNNHIVMQNS